MNKKTQITKKGLESLENELDKLVNEKRPHLVERLSNARSQGDLSENSDYQNARDDLEFLDGRISELEEVIRNAEIVESSGGDGQVVVGATVKLATKGQKHTFFIVGEWEADPAEKKISHTSPLGQALIGKQKGDEVEVEAPAGKIIYKILSIN